MSSGCRATGADRERGERVDGRARGTADGTVVPRDSQGIRSGRSCNRIVFLGSQVDDFNADAVISQLLLLDQQDPTKEIKLFINSPG